MAESAVLGDSAGGQGGQLPAALDLCHGGGAVEAQTPPGRRLLVVGTGQRLVGSSVQKWQFPRMPPNLLSFPAVCISEATIWVTVIREQRQRRSVHGNTLL